MANNSLFNASNPNNPTTVTPAAPPKPKLSLIKSSKKYKMVIPAQVEQKIRLACAALPHTEWSGVLFYTYSGTFERDNLCVKVRDILVMDVGSSAYTEWSADADVINYMAENDLLDCQMGIVHSHHGMQTFFSGTDTGTLHDEGQDRNNLVSLIVNNAGTYNAAITRMNKSVCKVSEIATYEFFGEGPKTFTDEYETEETYIEYFMFNIVRKEPLGLHNFFNRLQEIMRRPKPVTNIPPMSSQWYKGYTGSDASKPVTVLSQSPVNSLKDPVVPSKITTTADKLPFEVEDDLPVDEPITLTAEEKKAIEPCVEATAAQLLTGSVFCQTTEKFNLDQWVKTKMVPLYKRRFGENLDLKSEFRGWLDNYMEFIIFSTEWPDLDGFNEGDRSEIIAQALLDRLRTLPSNIYMEQIIESLEFYLS